MNEKDNMREKQVDAKKIFAIERAVLVTLAERKMISIGVCDSIIDTLKDDSCAT